ncbi:MAG: hypothetical protein ACLVK8_04215, partial [Ruminococcus sp.]
NPRSQKGCKIPENALSFVFSGIFAAHFFTSSMRKVPFWAEVEVRFFPSSLVKNDLENRKF